MGTSFPNLKQKLPVCLADRHRDFGRGTLDPLTHCVELEVFLMKAKYQKSLLGSIEIFLLLSELIDVKLMH